MSGSFMPFCMLCFLLVTLYLSNVPMSDTHLRPAAYQCLRYLQSLALIGMLIEPLSEACGTLLWGSLTAGCIGVAGFFLLPLIAQSKVGDSASDSGNNH